MSKTKRIIAAVTATFMTMSSSAVISANAVEETVNVSLLSSSENEFIEYTFNDIYAMTTEEVISLFAEKGLTKDNGYYVYGQGDDAEYVYCSSWNVCMFSEDFLSDRTVEEILTDYIPYQHGDCSYDKGESLWDEDRIVSALALPEEYFEVTVLKKRVIVKGADSTDKNKIACDCEIRCKLPEGEKRAVMRNAALNYLQLRKDVDKLLVDDAVPYYGKEKTAAQKYAEAICDFMANNDIQGVVSRDVSDEKLSIGFHGDHEAKLRAYISKIGLDKSGIPYEFEKLPDFGEFYDLNVTTVSQPTEITTTSTSVTTLLATVKGDANCDGTVDMADIVLIMQALANPNKYGENGTDEYHLTAQGKANADMDGDGLTVGDAQALQKMLLGLDDTNSSQSTDKEQNNNVVSQDVGFGQKWNGKPVSYELYTVLNNTTDENTVIFVYPQFKSSENYKYNGKTIAEYSEDVSSNNLLDEKLHQILKDGDQLKYGELLYTTGTPDGEKWAKELYEQRVGFYGDEFLAKYIINGEFLRDKVEADIKNFSNAPHNALAEALKAYKKSMIQDSIEQLKQQNIRYEYSEASDELIIKVTSEEFKSLSIENVLYYCLASTSFDYGFVSTNGANL
ncbi:dockerin type I repeat-containing protein [Ruminococcus sp.]|uniref:dockerin type I repeat-containing protein n=1 Tax=Ruminococcus sp. TaxID=41978 RepID=UPI0025DAEC31|nr:dockerin type I repeat-containing protein [Ruminococcus sp.]